MTAHHQLLSQAHHLRHQICTVHVCTLVYIILLVTYSTLQNSYIHKFAVLTPPRNTVISIIISYWSVEQSMAPAVLVLPYFHTQHQLL